MIFLSACSYSFTGASLSSEYKSFGIATIEDRTNSAEPNLIPKFREKLINKFINDNTLQYTDANKANLVFDIFITNFSEQFVSIQAGENVAAKKLSINVNVICYDMITNKKYFEQSFTNYQDYDPRGNFLQERTNAIDAILDKISEDILLRTISNW